MGYIHQLSFFFFKQKTAYEIGVRLVGSEMCIRDRINAVLGRRVMAWLRSAIIAVEDT